MLHVLLQKQLKEEHEELGTDVRTRTLLTLRMKQITHENLP